MEASGIGKISKFLEIPFIVAKGIGDYARDGKVIDNRFFEYACHTSYRFAIDFFIRRNEKNLESSSKSIKESMKKNLGMLFIVSK